MSVSLSSGVRSALFSLQSTSNQAQVAQNRLATGKRVNSAIDNPINFFTAGALNDRSSQLSSLLDGMSNAIQTIQAASKGIDGITKLLQSAQSTIKQAQTEAATNRPTKTGGTALATAAEVTATNKSLKDITLDKAIVDDNGGTANDATASYAGNLGVTASSFLSVYVSAGSTTYQASLSGTATVRDLVNEINKSGIATASVDANGKLAVTGTGSNTLKVGIGAATADQATADAAALTGGSNTVFGLLAADASTGITATGNSTVRTNLVQQFNDLRTQIDQLAKDAGFNGTNLLAGNKLSIVFNEKTGSAQNKLDVQGETVTAANLGVLAAQNGTGSGYNIQDDADLTKAADALTSAITTLRSTASSFGASLAVVQTRQDFTKSMIDTLKTGADNLVNADQNEEGAKLLALNTRQQLSQTALSLSSQSDQAILRLF